MVRKKNRLIYPGLASRLEQRRKEGTTTSSPELVQRLSLLQFWCNNNTIHLEKPDTYQDDFCCLTHVVGLPRHPATKIPMSLTPYQVEFLNKVIQHKKPKDGQSKIEAMRDSHKFHINKGRQMGFTEIVLRIIQYYCFHEYAGSKVGIIAATNGSLARKDLRRLARLFYHIQDSVTSWKGNTITLQNNTTIEAFPASEEAMTGDTNYKCIYMDEAAKWRVNDDTPIFNSIIPIVNTNGADLFLVSTPKKPIKMFYEIHKEPKDYLKIKYDIWFAKDNLYTEQQIQKMIDDAKEDPNQEYLCKFVFGKDAILGEVTDDMHIKHEEEWDYAERQEDDGYVESADDIDPDDVWNMDDDS